MLKTIAFTLLLLCGLTSLTEAQMLDFRGSGSSPIIIAPDGQYVGNLNNNQFDPNSVANPFGRYGSQFSPNSPNNQFGPYGNPYSPNYVPLNRRRY